MKCRNCPKVATLHVTEIVKGVVQEHHLCEDCARPFLEKATPGSAGAAGKPAESEAESEEYARLICPTCQMSYKEFRNIGRLGCADCYTSFRDELLPLIENIHGETQHAGKSPRQVVVHSDQKQFQLMKLRNDLRQAVTDEQYEKAAQLRDQIQNLESSLAEDTQ